MRDTIETSLKAAIKSGTSSTQRNAALTSSLMQRS
jgi:hypothetical protein